MTDSQRAITRGFARALGPFLILFGAAIAARSAEIGMLAAGFFQDNALALVTGAFTLAAGCAMLAAHHHFNSLPAIVVSIFSIITTLRGLVLLAAPGLIAPFAANLGAGPGVILIPAAIAVLIGVYLTFAGWFAKPAA